MASPPICTQLRTTTSRGRPRRRVRDLLLHVRYRKRQQAHYSCPDNNGRKAIQPGSVKGSISTRQTPKTPDEALCTGNWGFLRSRGSVNRARYGFAADISCFRSKLNQSVWGAQTRPRERESEKGAQHGTTSAQKQQCPGRVSEHDIQNLPEVIPHPPLQGRWVRKTLSERQVQLSQQLVLLPALGQASSCKAGDQGEPPL